jgi:hypothetical protein
MIWIGVVDGHRVTRQSVTTITAIEAGDGAHIRIIDREQWFRKSGLRLKLARAGTEFMEEQSIAAAKNDIDLAVSAYG